ncbi:stage II sporulation protein E, partial [bacterium]|nr:stage II sporulation protein E [bacterium]
VERDLEIARQIQSSFLPLAPPQLLGAAVACRCVPAAHVGGDYYDFFTRSGNTLDIVIADVSGHNVGAALIMAEARSVLQAVVRAAEPPGEILATLNNLLYEDLTRAELFITLFYLHYDPVSRTVVYANAGHNPPLVLRNGIPACMELDADGLILGVKKAVTFEEKVFELQQGDILVLYTDGITEAQNEEAELFGAGRLCESMAANRTKPPGELVDAVLEEVRAFTRSPSLDDDISLVVLQVL